MLGDRPVALANSAAAADRDLYEKPCRSGVPYVNRSQGVFPSMLIGSMRVSTDNDRQSTDLQRDALVAALDLG